MLLSKSRARAEEVRLTGEGPSLRVVEVLDVDWDIGRLSPFSEIGEEQVTGF